MSITITEVRNAQSLQTDNARMDVEINHPTHGWIPYTLDPADTDTTINNDELLELIGSDYAAYVPPTQASLDAIAAVAYKDQRAAAYPSIADQLDQIYHEGLDAWKATILAVKAEYPKP